jgi:hypothetical protein
MLAAAQTVSEGQEDTGKFAGFQQVDNRLAEPRQNKLHRDYGTIAMLQCNMLKNLLQGQALVAQTFEDTRSKKSESLSLLLEE